MDANGVAPCDSPALANPEPVVFTNATVTGLQPGAYLQQSMAGVNTVQGMISAFDLRTLSGELGQVLGGRLPVHGM
jgi:hypothetical protein